MLIMLLPDQIPMFWNEIKYAISKSYLSSDRLLDYFNHMLVDLLNSKSQCFFRIDNERQLNAVVITSFMADSLTDNKTLLISHVYSFKATNDNEWRDNLATIVDYARNTGCVKIVIHTNNDRALELSSMLGFSECYRCLCLNI